MNEQLHEFPKEIRLTRRSRLVDAAIAKGEWTSGGTTRRDRLLFTGMGVGLAALFMVMLIL